MKIILENVVKGARVTGIAKIVEGNEVLNNVPFNVGTKTELDMFINSLTAVQEEFIDVSDGEYTADPLPVKEIDPVEEALNSVYLAKAQLEAKIITEAEYLAKVDEYKILKSKN